MSQREIVAIDTIVLDPEVQPRDHLDESIVEHYLDLYNSGDSLPEVRLHEINGIVYMCDGFKRLEAAKRAGRQTIAAHIRKQSTRGALIIDAIKSNAMHGEPLTQAERRAAIERLVGVFRDSETPWQASDIADIVKVSESTVRRVAKQAFPDDEEPKARTIIDQYEDETPDHIDEQAERMRQAEEKDDDDLTDESPAAKAKREQIEGLIEKGRKLPDSIFESCRHITAALNAAKRTPGCEYLVQNMTTLLQAKDTLLSVKEMRPEKVCPNCNGFGCPACHERGWINFNQSKRL